MSNTAINEFVSSYDNVYLNLSISDVAGAVNPFTHLSQKDIDQPDLFLVRILRDPKHFGFTVKYLLNIELLPIQIAILQELWVRPFPMFIASRGFGKLLSGDEKLRIKDGWTTMREIKIGDSVYGGDGELTKVIAKTNLQKQVEFYKITLRDGRTIECCEDHMWKVWDKNKNRVSNDTYCNLTTKELVQNYYWVRKDSKSKQYKLTKEYRYALPINKPLIQESYKDVPIHPYIVGVLLGDGCLVGNGITITSNDLELIEKVNTLLPDGYVIKAQKAKYTYGISRTDKTLPAFSKLCEQIGILGLDSHNKFIPQDYQYGSHSQRLELIRGLNDTDGYSSKSVIEYYTVSDRLSEDYLNVARSLGLHCKHSLKESWFKGSQYADCHRISIYTKTPIFSLARKLKYVDHKISKQGASKYDKVFITNIEYIGKKDGYCISVDNEDRTYITKDYIVTHNSWLLAVYATLKCLLIPKTKIVIVGAGLRQSKVIFEYMETIWNDAPILRSICDKQSGPRTAVDRCIIHINDSWAVALPVGDGSKIRGLRAHTIICDEFASLNPSTYETVIGGFAAVSQAPKKNVQEAAKRRKMKEDGVWNPDLEKLYLDSRRQNQSIITGTADYGFKHFAQYFHKYDAIINSRGDEKKLNIIFGEDVPDAFKNWKDYSIMRVPYEKIPEGFMDDKIVARARGTMHMGIYQMEYGAVFTDDSDGFFKRSLIESCVTDENKPTMLPSGPVWFDPVTRGNPKLKYVFGIDPASEIDNFTIWVLELHSDHTRIVYGWATSKKNFKERQEASLTGEHDYYSFCARKIRELMKVFPCVRIGIDSQGGGFAIMESLHDPEKMQPGEQLIWPVKEEDKEKDTDYKPGLHILEPINFASADWTSAANHGMRKDFEDKVLLFPRYDNITLGLAIESDAENIRNKTGGILYNAKTAKIYDNMEDCVYEIEQLKAELSTIIITKTLNNNRDRWDTPEVKELNGKKGRLRKDRYSALLMANMLARNIQRADTPPSYNLIGGASHTIVIPKNLNGAMYEDGGGWERVDPNVFQGIQRQ